MLGKKKRERELRRRQEEKRREAYDAREREGARITRRTYELRKFSRDRVGEEALLLFKDAQHQVALVRQSIADRTHYDFTYYDEDPKGDLATSLAEDVTGVMRENTVNPQTVWEALSERFPDVNFTVDWFDVTSMVAAMIREMHMAGVLEGLELAGALPDSTKRRP